MDLMRIVKAADELEEYLGANCGTTADFPCDIKCDNQESAIKVASLLAELHAALEVYRLPKKEISG